MKEKRNFSQKKYSLLVVFALLFTSYTWAQVGIGVANPSEALEVNGSIKMVDTNQGAGKVMVSDADGKGSWKNAETLTDGVITKVIRNIGGGTNTDIILWSHPSGIEVRFNTGTEKITVENKSTDDTHYWDIVANGGGLSSGTNESTQYIFKYLRDDGTNDLLNYDIGDDDRGWFKIIASDQNNQLDGFILQIVYFADNFNGMVQYWDEP